jgi:hypothetical protein
VDLKMKQLTPGPRLTLKAAKQVSRYNYYNVPLGDISCERLKGETLWVIGE